MIRPVTPRQRDSLSRKYLLRLARLILPFIGAPLTKVILDQIAKVSFEDLVSLRRGYRVLAAQAASHQLGRDQVISLPAIREYVVQDWRKAVGRAFHEDAATPGALVDRAGVSRALVRADLHGRNAERNTMIAVALAEDEVAGWARVDWVSPTCPLCRITISRGPVYTSKQAAGGDGNVFHGGCTCVQVLVLRGQENSWPGRELYLAEKQRYKDAKGNAAQYRKLVAKANDDAGETGVTKQVADKATGLNEKESPDGG